MCWITTEKPMVHVADSDFKVYKIVYNQTDDDEVLSFYKNYRYKIGHLYEMKGRLIPGTILNDEYFKAYGINKGFHSDATPNKAISIYQELTDDLFFGFGVGTNINDSKGIIAKKPMKPTIVECIIPKYSRYYINIEDEIISDKIIISGFPQIYFGKI